MSLSASLRLENRVHEEEGGQKIRHFLSGFAALHIAGFAVLTYSIPR
jgi:hypothetical protein